MGYPPRFDRQKIFLASGLPLDRDQALKMFSDIFWHPIDRCPLERVPDQVLEYRIRQGTREHARQSIRISNLVKALKLHLEDAGFVSKDGTVMPKGREHLFDTHPKQSQLWLALRDIWSNRLALIITGIGLLSGLLAIAQWLGWLPQRLEP